jgi:hypothetical protein
MNAGTYSTIYNFNYAVKQLRLFFIVVRFVIRRFLSFGILFVDQIVRSF